MLAALVFLTVTGPGKLSLDALANLEDRRRAPSTV
jgi:hypothetical protein